MAATLFDALFNGHALPSLTETFGETVVAWESGQERVTAIQLPSGLTYTAIFHEHAAEKIDNNGTISNVIKGNLWVPTSAKPAQRSTWRIVRSDDSQLDVTGVCHGARSGGLLCVEVEQVTVSKFAGSFR